MALFFQDLANGVLAGGILALAAIGFSLVWGVMNIINLAHGAFLMLGAYLTYILYAGLGAEPLLGVPLAFATLAVAGYAIQRTVINRVVRAPMLTTFLLTFGLSFFIVNAVLLVFHGDSKAVTTPYSGANFALGPLVIPWVKFVTLLCAIAIAGLVQAWLSLSRTGRAIRATASDIGAAELCGIRTAELYAIVFGLGAGLAGAAGALLSLSYGITPAMGDPFVVKAFVVCVLGGLGSVGGAVAGGLLFGILEAVGSQYIGTGLQDVSALAVLVIVLLVRPRGLFGRATA